MRPDQRCMERGEWDQAGKLKAELENQQRQNRKRLIETFNETGKPSGPASRGIPIGEEWWVPRWFFREKDPDTNDEYWKFTNEYCK